MILSVCSLYTCIKSLDITKHVVCFEVKTRSKYVERIIVFQEIRRLNTICAHTGSKSAVRDRHMNRITLKQIGQGVCCYFKTRSWVFLSLSAKMCHYAYHKEYYSVGREKFSILFTYFFSLLIHID